jgi:type III pantothenate kinase
LAKQVETNQNQESWLALMIGNSRLHWAWVAGNQLSKHQHNDEILQTWNTRHLLPDEVSPDRTLLDILNNFKEIPDATLAQLRHNAKRSQIPLWVASVVPFQTALWQAYAKTRFITLNDIPLQNLYPSLGIDRALAVWGAAQRFGLPALVIDAGTALTFTGADPAGKFVGGAILPGLGLQIRSLTEHTAALPAIQPQFDPALPRWAQTTTEAITSGIIHTLIAGLQAFITDWRQTYPNSTVVLTGGDGLLLFQYLQQSQPTQVKFEANLVFWGMEAIVQEKGFTTVEA